MQVGVGQESRRRGPEQEPRPWKRGPKWLSTSMGKTGCISSLTTRRQDAPWRGAQDLEHFPSPAEWCHQSRVNSKDSRTLNSFISDISRVPTCHPKPVILTFAVCYTPDYFSPEKWWLTSSSFTIQGSCSSLKTASGLMVWWPVGWKHRAWPPLRGWRHS